MQAENTIEHNGVIESITDSTICVRITKTSACGACAAYTSCPVSGGESHKIIEAANPQAGYTVGESVTVMLKQSQGYKALFLGYGVPFILVLVTLIATIQITNNELIAGLVSLGMLMPYYLILFLMRDSLQRSFTFTIKR